MSDMNEFYTGVMKSFAEHSSSDEIVRTHGPENHGGHGLHSQINLINRTDGNCFKVRFSE